jgi:hypothetical protein
MSNIVECKLTHRTKAGTLVRSAATLEYVKGRIFFLKSPFALKDEIKSMRGSKYHGYDEENPRKIWSVDDCQRNRFQLGFLLGEDVYAWFDRDVITHEYRHPLKPHQCDLSDSGLTYHYQIWASEMGTGKTLSAQMVMEKSGINHWWWVGPKSSLPNMRREFKKWGFNFDEITVEWMTYEELTCRMDEWGPGDFLPQGVIFDESSRCKTDTSQRAKAAQMLANLIREKYGFTGFVIEMSGTPSPKSPLDWWSQCEIAWPGFLKEGSRKALEKRLAFTQKQSFVDGITVDKRIGWKDDERKCAICGEFAELGPHELDGITDPKDYHAFQASENEVAYLAERLKGLVIVKMKKDCLDLPDKRYRRVICKPTSSTLRVAKALHEAAPNTITGLTWLRELSDGFQYKEVKDGTLACPHCPESSGKVDEWFLPGDEDRVFGAIDMLDAELVARLQKRSTACPRCGGDKIIDKMVRIAREVPCPKDKALKADLETCEETGRIVIFAGFTGAVDRVQKLCQKEGWNVVRCDGRGFQVTDPKGEVICQGGDDALAFWADMSNERVAFDAHPESGGMSLTLVESRMAVFWSNTFKPDYRSQAEDRIHRMGMDLNLGCEIVDYIHLPSDSRVLQVLQQNRQLELMTLGVKDLGLDGDGDFGDFDAGVEIVELAA